jgi:hypothetical protein
MCGRWRLRFSRRRLGVLTVLLVTRLTVSDVKPISSCNCTNVLDCVWNVMAHAQKPDFVFRRKGRSHLNRWRRHFSRLLAAEFYAAVVVMLDTPCSEAVWRVLATHSIPQFPLHFPSLRHRVPWHFDWILPTLNFVLNAWMGMSVSWGWEYIIK